MHTPSGVDATGSLFTDRETKAQRGETNGTRLFTPPTWLTLQGHPGTLRVKHIIGNVAGGGWGGKIRPVVAKATSWPTSVPTAVSISCGAAVKVGDSRGD